VRIMRSQRSDLMILLLSIIPVALGIALVMHANSDGSLYFVSAPPVNGTSSLPSFLPSPVVLALRPLTDWAASISYMPLATREEMAFGIVIGGIGFIIAGMCVMDLLTSARRKRKTQHKAKRDARGATMADEPLQMYVAASRPTDRGASA